MKKHLFSLALLCSIPYICAEQNEQNDQVTVRAELSLEQATVNCDVDAVKVALTHKSGLNRQDEQTGNTALMALFSSDACDDAECADKKAIVEITQLFIDHEADLSLTNNDGHTVLDLAKQHGHTAAAELLASCQN